jgi:hypothetical protein
LCLSQNTSCPSVTLNGGPFETAKARDSFSAPPQPVHGVCKNPLSSSLWLCVCVCVCVMSQSHFVFTLNIGLLTS